jgi:hypothetical protein
MCLKYNDKTSKEVIKMKGATYGSNVSFVF